MKDLRKAMSYSMLFFCRCRCCCCCCCGDCCRFCFAAAAPIDMSDQASTSFGSPTATTDINIQKLLDKEKSRVEAKAKKEKKDVDA
ncbi:hypothetical protein BV898_18508 [Hypsibius exemplaris]|uniref:Uncharacterized protein n=1 Tax=Hypsibius exemplaris TaxID=2072580 RepID=A0A9X6NIY6_HYPEX|nr:hypothetical protein BV898_18508 [Hypsibius exemplaris]